MTDRHEPPPLDGPPAEVAPRDPLSADHRDDRDSNDRRVALPAPDVRRTRFPFPLVWIVPLLAAIAAGYYLWGIYKDRGVEIAISFGDASNLRVRETPLNYHGVRVGSVTSLDLTEDRNKALVRVRLERPFQDGIAREGGKFWLVRPDAGGGMLSGLSTVITGPYIDCEPGHGAHAARFDGLDGRPVLLGDGLRIVLHTDRLAHLEVQSPVFFRGMQVGAVQDIRFDDNATGVNVTLFIWKNYAKLVRPGSQFWEASGTDIQGSVLGGLSLQINNLRALVAGGVAFATPNDGDARAVREGASFPLNDAADKAWLKWSPTIPLTAEENSGQPDNGPTPRPTIP